MGLIHKLMPTRNDYRPTKIIADLDDLISQPIGFKYLGKNYIIEPMTTRNFMLVTKALHELEQTLKKRSEPEFNEEEVYRVYYEFVSSLCPKITLFDIKQAKIPQLHALLNLMIQHITGTTAKDMVIDEEKKKNLENQKLSQVNYQNSILSRSLLSCLTSIRSLMRR